MTEAGASGTGKTRSIVIPNILQATGSYIISDPKGNLYRFYRGYLQKEGYTVKLLDFKNFEASACYNPFLYIHNEQDILQVAYMLIHQRKESGIKADPFWDDAAVLLLSSLISFMFEAEEFAEKIKAKIEQRRSLFKLADIPENGRYVTDGDEDMEYCRRIVPNYHYLSQLVDNCSIPEDGNGESRMDSFMKGMERYMPESFALRQYKKFRVAASRTLRSILITVNSYIGTFDIPGLVDMTGTDTVDLPSIGKKRTALFVSVSDTDRSLDGLVNIFFTQAMHELVGYADGMPDSRLPVPVRFILDDFATNCMIADFPRMISSIRSREISAMLMIQSEGQLEQCYGKDGATIIGNCDTYVYLGGNDLQTARVIAERTDKPLKSILGMPVGTGWIFRRGQEPVFGRNFNLAEYSRIKEKGRLKQEERAVS